MGGKAVNSKLNLRKTGGGGRESRRKTMKSNVIQWKGRDSPGAKRQERSVKTLPKYRERLGGRKGDTTAPH